MAFRLRRLMKIESMKTPVFIPTWNNPTYTRSIVNQICKIGLKKQIVILDGRSSYPEMRVLLRELKAEGIHVIQMHANFGPRILCTQRILFDSLLNTFIITDPDLDLASISDSSFIGKMENISNALAVGKVGLALQIDDLPETSTLTIQMHGKMYSIVEWEKQFWEKEIVYPGAKVYKADVDSTFALYNKRHYKNFYEAVRVSEIEGSSVAVKHLPWYLSRLPPQQEMKFYLNPKNKNIISSWWVEK